MTSKMTQCLLLPGGYNYTVGTKHGFFRPDLLWPIAMGGMYIFSLLILLYVIQQRLQVTPSPALTSALPPWLVLSMAHLSTVAKAVHAAGFVL